MTCRRLFHVHAHPGQALFARQVGATSLIDPAEAGGPVFLYRDDELMTERWLVDSDGKVLDSACSPVVGLTRQTSLTLDHLCAISGPAVPVADEEATRASAPRYRRPVMSALR